MKSKSEIKKNAADKAKQTTYDFVNFYKSASNINVFISAEKRKTHVSINLMEKRKTDAGSFKENIISNKLLTPKREGNKTNKKIQKSIADTLNINIYGDSLSYANETASLDDSKITSTPNVAKKKRKPKVKSLNKNKSLIETSMEVSQVSMSNKPTKRNKSVSLMLDDTEEIAVKKCKSQKTVNNLEIPDKSLGKIKKSKKNMQDEKGNKKKHKNKGINNIPTENLATTTKFNIENTPDHNEIKEMPDVNKVKKVKTVKLEITNSANLIKEAKEAKIKKIRRKKRPTNIPTELGTDNAETEGEPAKKSSRKEVKAEKMAQDLQNLNIGDNAHTLTNLLNEMTVVDKNKKKKNKQKIKDRERKEKKYNPTSTNSESEDAEKKKGKDKKLKMNKAMNTNTEQSTNTEGEVSEEKEKVKWVKRKWNKDKKGGASVDKHLTSVIVENLPLNIMFTYKKLLAEHFEKVGMIRQVGIAEMYTTEDPKPVFTTTINFYSEDGAEKALEEDNTVLGGARIRVKRPLPPTLTTLVVRSYAHLTEQALSSVFSGAGPIRSIRHLVKGKKSLSTAFIEFDGAKSVERAIKMVDEATIGGKKIHVAKYELRAPKKKRQDKSQGDKEDSDISDE